MASPASSGDAAGAVVLVNRSAGEDAPSSWLHTWFELATIYENYNQREIHNSEELQHPQLNKPSGRH